MTFVLSSCSVYDAGYHADPLFTLHGQPHAFIVMPEGQVVSIVTSAYNHMVKS